MQKSASAFSSGEEEASNGGVVVNDSLNRLTERQRGVLFLLCKGFHNPEIAKQAGLSPRVVKECVHELLLIYEVSNRTELAGLLGPESSGFSSYEK